MTQTATAHHAGRKSRAQLERSLAMFRAAAEARPKDAVRWRDLSAPQMWLGHLQEAEESLRRAIALAPADPANHFFLGTCLLSQGRYAEAWPHYESRFAVPELNLGAPTEMPMPFWRGEDPVGKRILVVPEQGLGDQMQFARFLPRLRQAGVKVALLVGKPLEALYRHSFRDIYVVPTAPGTLLPPADYWTTAVCLAARMGVTLETLPTAPYLEPPFRWDRPSAGFKVGLMAAGNAAYVNDVNRSLGPDKIATLRAGLPGRVIDLDPANTKVVDFAQTAAIIRELDLIVSVDTSVAHLAGAMGKRCLVLIPGIQTDWRWMYDRSDSLWYPMHRLYRNPIDGDWSAPIADLVRDAHLLAAGGTLADPVRA